MFFISHVLAYGSKKEGVTLCLNFVVFYFLFITRKSSLCNYLSNDVPLFKAS